MSQKDMYNNEILEEILRERVNFFRNKKKQINFWIVNNPYFLKENMFKKINWNKGYFFDKTKGGVDKEFTCLLSTDSNFIEWIKLRLGYFEEIHLLNGNIKEIYKSNGLFGELNKFAINIKLLESIE
jgi:hypothetical protein